ncbi:hypothetical protein ABZ614_32475 [Streptomyces sp. NPDC013178]|uniref:hypothetical protein n=1 Tax=unclassified Streptomyces TaxID=2593676 RepID=UPI0033E1B8DD
MNPVRRRRAVAVTAAALPAGLCSPPGGQAAERYAGTETRRVPQPSLITPAH